MHFVLRFIGTQVYLCFITPYKETSSVPLFTRETAENLSYQLNLGFMNLLMGVWGWWAFDVFTLICSYLSCEVISAQTIMRTLGLLTFMIPVGFTYSCGLLVGKFVGEGNAVAVKHYFWWSMSLAALVGIGQVLLLATLRGEVIGLFTTHEETAAQMRLAWDIFLIFVFFDTTQGVASGAIRGSGK